MHVTEAHGIVPRLQTERDPTVIATTQDGAARLASVAVVHRLLDPLATAATAKMAKMGHCGGVPAVVEVVEVVVVLAGTAMLVDARHRVARGLMALLMASVAVVVIALSTVTVVGRTGAPTARRRRTASVDNSAGRRTALRPPSRAPSASDRTWPACHPPCRAARS